MKNCPINFYNNCSNAMLMCHKCAAGNCRRTTLFYTPKEDIGEHPITFKKEVEKPKKDLAKSRLVKKALKGEQKQIDKINSQIPGTARATLASGRVRHDGDALHLDLRVERKHRKYYRSVTVSATELAKGRKDAIDVFEIFLEDAGRTYYVMPEDTYINLLSAHVKALRRVDQQAEPSEHSS
jgi:hypothetical protein